MWRITLTMCFITLPIVSIFSQGFNIPAKQWGLSFGNSTRFDGIRFNLVDKDIEKINGINIGGLGVGAGGDVKGISVSAFNHIEGDVFGVCIGVFNWAYAIRGFQLGILNHVKSNPKGLRWLPIFNTSFGS